MEGENNASLINSFVEITSASKEEAVFFLESHSFDLDAAVSTFFDDNNSDSLNPIDDTNVVAAAGNNRASSSSPSPSESQSPSRSRSASPTPSRAPYQLRSKGKAAAKAKGKKASGSRAAGRIRTLSDLNRPASHDSDDSESDETQEYYTGGHKRVEQNIRRISTDMATVKCDLAILKSLMVEFLNDFRPNQHSEGPNNQIDDSLVLKSSHKIAQIDGIEEHKNEIEDEEKVKDVAEIESEMNFINGASVEEITASTWEQFSEKRVETNATDVSRFLIFALSKAEAISGSSQRQWILIRVYKAQCGRSPIHNWRGKLIGLGYGKKKAHIFIHLLQNPNKQLLHTWLQNTTKSFSFNKEFVIWEARARIAQDEDEEPLADYYFRDEPYEAWYWVFIFKFSDCLVLITTGFEFSGMFSTAYNVWTFLLFFYMSYTRKLEMGKFTYLNRPEDIQLQFCDWMIRKHLNFADTEEVLRFGCSDFSHLGSLVGFLNLCLLRLNCEILYFSMTKAEKERPISMAEKVGGIVLLSDFWGPKSMGRKGKAWLLCVQLSKQDYSLVWIYHDVQILVPAAMMIKKGSFRAMGKFHLDWIQMGIICFGWKKCCCFVGDVWSLFKPYQNHFDPSKHLVFGISMHLNPLLLLGLVVAEMPIIAACRFHCWLGVFQFHVDIIEVILIIIKATKVVITAMTDWLGSWLKSFYIKKQKLILMLAYHLEDKVAIHGGGNDEIGPSCTYYRKLRNEVMVK